LGHRIEKEGLTVKGGAILARKRDDNEKKRKVGRGASKKTGIGYERAAPKKNRPKKRPLDKRAEGQRADSWRGPKNDQGGENRGDQKSFFGLLWS